MRSSISFAALALVLWSMPALAQQPADPNAPPPAGTEQPAGGDQGGGGGGEVQQMLTGVVQRLRDAGQQLQGGDQAVIGQAGQSARQALDDLQGAMQQMQQGGQAPGQDQMNQIQQQIDQARGELDSNPQQAGGTITQLADRMQQFAGPQQPEIPPEADRIIGKTLVTSAGEEAGEVSDVLVTADGRIVAVLVDQGGVLGVGERKVALAWTQIQLQGDQLQVNMSADEIGQLPEYKVD